MSTDRPLAYQSRFEDCRPDLYHELAYTVCRPYLTPATRCLDVGCWVGGFEQLLDGQISAVGVDRDAQAIRLATQGMRPQHQFLVGDVCALPFSAGRFDMALLNYVLEHIPDGQESRLLQEIARVLRADGRLVILVPRRHWLHAVCDVAHWLTGHRHFHLEEVVRWLREAGFVVDTAQVRGGVLAALSIPWFYAAKYLFGINLYKIPWAKVLLHREYARPSGFRDCFVVARRAP